MAVDHKQEELFHIRKMVLELERLVQNGDIEGGETPVGQPEYWRNRINALLATRLISGSAATQAAALLGNWMALPAGWRKGIYLTCPGMRVITPCQGAWRN